MKAVKVKWAERMELYIENEGQYFEKVWAKKTDSESEDSDEKTFFRIFLAFSRGVRANVFTKPAVIEICLSYRHPCALVG